MGLFDEAIELYDRHFIAVDFFNIHLVFLPVYFLAPLYFSMMKRWSRVQVAREGARLDQLPDPSP